MDFVAVVDQVIALLRQRGRVTYRTLQLQFMLDDTQLAALKDELLYSQSHVLDDTGRGLIWNETPETTPASPLTSQEAPLSAAPMQNLWPAATSDAANAERRQLTVLFCDLVDSTRLSTQLDPEDYREVVQAYQQVCAEVIQQFEGHIAQYLGDGLLVYFGHPQAHEDDARRAVQAALGILEAMGMLGARLTAARNIRLAVRIGIHTGLVVVGEIGGAGTREWLALGNTPNIAARLQGLAAPNTVVISEATARLSQGYFVWQALGAQTLKGIAQPMPVYEVLRASGAQSRLDAVPARRLAPLIDRDEEVELLQRRWEYARRGAGQVVLLSGEAGIGKSRLVQVLKESLVNEPHRQMEWRSSPYHQQSAFYPVVDFLHHWLHWRPDEQPSERLHTLEAMLASAGLWLTEGVPLLAAALLAIPVPPSSSSLPLTPQQQRQRTLALLLAWLQAEAQHQPLLLVVEDLHWTDPSTLELLSLLIEQSAQMGLYLVLTSRPEFRLPWPPVPHLTTLALRRFPPASIERLATHIAGDKRLPSVVLHEVVQRTDGVPLFVEELTRMVLESGLLQEQDNDYTISGPFSLRAIPSTLQDSLMARLDRLGSVKVVAQLGAIIGRTFTYDLLQAIVPLDEIALQQNLQQLVEAENCAVNYQRSRRGQHKQLPMLRRRDFRSGGPLPPCCKGGA